MNVTPCCPIEAGGLEALVVDDAGKVVAVIRAAAGVEPAEFHAAMRQLDATYDESEWGHG